MERTNYDALVLEAVAEAVMPVGATHLAEKLSIPPANVGRTLARLEKQGFVEKINNKGRCITEEGQMFLRASRERQAKIDAAKEIIDMSQEKDSERLKEILVARQLLEGYTAMQCAVNASEELLKKLEDIQYDYEYELRHGRAGSEKDLELHLTIAEGSGNIIIAQILQMVLTEKKSYTEYSKAAMRSHRLSVEEHAEIIKAIKKHDGDAAKKEMEAHLKRVRDNVEIYEHSDDTDE